MSVRTVILAAPQAVLPGEHAIPVATLSARFALTLMIPALRLLITHAMRATCTLLRLGTAAIHLVRTATSLIFTLAALVILRHIY